MHNLVYSLTVGNTCIITELVEFDAKVQRLQKIPLSNWPYLGLSYWHEIQYNSDSGTPDWAYPEKQDPSLCLSWFPGQRHIFSSSTRKCSTWGEMAACWQHHHIPLPTRHTSRPCTELSTSVGMNPMAKRGSGWPFLDCNRQYHGNNVLIRFTEGWKWSLWMETGDWNGAHNLKWNPERGSTILFQPRRTFIRMLRTEWNPHMPDSGWVSHKGTYKRNNHRRMWQFSRINWLAAVKTSLLYQKMHERRSEHRHP